MISGFDRVPIMQVSDIKSLYMGINTTKLVVNID